MFPSHGESSRSFRQVAGSVDGEGLELTVMSSLGEADLQQWTNSG